MPLAAVSIEVALGRLASLTARDAAEDRALDVEDAASQPAPVDPQGVHGPATGQKLIG